MRFPYLSATVKAPIPSLGGSLLRPRPVIAVRVFGPAGSHLIDGLLDTGSDDTVLEEWIAGLLGVDLTKAIHRDIGSSASNSVAMIAKSYSQRTGVFLGR